MLFYETSCLTNEVSYSANSSELGITLAQMTKSLLRGLEDEILDANKKRPSKDSDGCACKCVIS